MANSGWKNTLQIAEEWTQESAKMELTATWRSISSMVLSWKQKNHEAEATPLLSANTSNITLNQYYSNFTTV